MTQLTKQRKKMIFMLGFFILVFLFAVVFFLYLTNRPSKKEEDYTLLSTGKYDSVFLSMYPIDSYDEADYEYYRAMKLAKTSYSIADISELETYFNYIDASGNKVHTVYLGIDPTRMKVSDLRPLLKKYPEIIFEIVPAYPQISYWTSLEEAEWKQSLSDYEDFIDSLLSVQNANVYSFFMQEWLIANPGNYGHGLLLQEDVAQILMLNTDYEHPYLITKKNQASLNLSFQNLIAEVRNTPVTYCDLSDWSIIFLGDSILGNFSGSTSLPGVVHGLTGATVFNLGCSGDSAANRDSNSLISFPVAANACIEKDLAPFERNDALRNNAASLFASDLTKSQLCFVINYGVNDYFNGYPISSEDPNDSSTYSGAIRSAVSSLRQAYPNALILLQTPAFTSYHNNGTEKLSEEGGILTDYVNAVIALGKELDIPILDNYHDLGINEKNYASYLQDGCHPNEPGRYLMGEALSNILGDLQP